MNNEGAVVIEDTDFQINNPWNDNAWTVDPNNDTGSKSEGGFFNNPNLNTKDVLLEMCRSLNKIQRTGFLESHALVRHPNLSLFRIRRVIISSANF